VNNESLDLVDSAVFIMCLDDLDFGADITGAIHNYLHGDVQDEHHLNRWFDKSMSVIMTAEGRAAINFEHSWGDGVAVMRFFNEIYKDTNLNHFVKPTTNSNNNNDYEPSKEVTRLKFVLDPECKAAHQVARTAFRERAESLSIGYVIYDGLERSFFKENKVSPDSMFQLAFQFAFNTVHGYWPATYEASSTSAFKHGRTETVRAATEETKRAVQALQAEEGEEVAKEEVRELIRACSKRHNQLVKEAAMGEGFDRHLWVMQKLAEKRFGKDHLPAFYLDKSWKFANHYAISSSTLNGECFAGGAFGPVVQDGYGIGYGFFDVGLGCAAVAYKEHKDAEQFARTFIQGIQRIKRVLED